MRSCSFDPADATATRNAQMGWVASALATVSSSVRSGGTLARVTTIVIRRWARRESRAPVRIRHQSRKLKRR